MGFFSGIRRRIKKLIPKEVRPFIPYVAAAFPFAAPAGLGALGAKGAMGSFLRAGLAKGLSDDEADLKDILRTGAIAAAPQMIDAGIGKLAAGDGRLAEMLNATKMVDGKETLSLAQTAGRMANPETLMGQAKLIGGQGSVDYGIKAAELNEDALADYNRMLAEQGIADKAGRRAAIRAIYANTGTWDMDEVDSMLDTYGYRTGGRVGYAMGDFVDTDQIVEDFQRIPSIGKGIGNLARAGVDNIDKIIEVIIKTNPILATGDKIVEILVERYGVDPEVAQRKVINRMSDANEGFGPQGSQGTPDEGFIERGLGPDAGAEDYYVDTPEGRRPQERMPRLPDLNIPPIPMPEMQPDPGIIPPMPMPTIPRDPRYFDMEREPFDKGGKTKKFDESDFYNSFQYAKEGLESLEEAEDEIKPLPIRELRLARGGITDINMEEQIDTPSGDMMMDENIQVASDPSPMDELDSLSLMLFRKPLSELTDDEYEDLKDFASQQSLKPGLIDEYRNYKYEMEEQGRTPMSPRDYFRMEFGAARMGVAKGGPIKKKKVMSIATGKLKDYPGIKKILEMNKKGKKRFSKAEGGLMNLAGNEMDLRGGGFVPMGAKERADDVPARLSKNEFVMTADAVRGAGGGSVEKGADLMYDQMKRLEGQA